MKKKIFLLLLVVLLGAGVALYMHFGSAAKRIIETAGSEALGVPVKVSMLGIAVSDFQATLGGITVGNPKGYSGRKLVEMENITVKLGDVTSDTVTIKSVLVDGMTVSYETGTAGSNLDRVKANIAQASGTAVKSPRIIIEKLRIINARVIPAIEGYGKGAIPVADITISNIGSDENPATAGQVAAQVMNRVILSSMIAVVKADIVGVAKDVKSGLKAIKGIFSK